MSIFLVLQFFRFKVLSHQILHNVLQPTHYKHYFKGKKLIKRFLLRSRLLLRKSAQAFQHIETKIVAKNGLKIVNEGPINWLVQYLFIILMSVGVERVAKELQRLENMTSSIWRFFVVCGTNKSRGNDNHKM